ALAGAALVALLASAPARAQEGGERAALAQLEQRSRTFYGLLERGERERAAAAWPGLEADLARFRDGLQARLDRMRDEVIERDGDLEELYRSPRWRDPEVLTPRLGELLPRAATGDAAAEKDATALARGLAARGGPWPARVSSLAAERLGGGTPAGVHSTYGLFLLAQLAVDRGRCGDVPP